MLKIGIIAAGLIFLAIISFSIISDRTGVDVPTIEPRDGSHIYLVSSETCPHCLTLKDYLYSKDTEVDIIETTEKQIVNSILKSYGLTWNFGVPLLFAVADSEIIVISGFPSESQNFDGYFMGHDYELQLCESSGGEQFSSGGVYKFCTMRTGFTLGNIHSVDNLLEICETQDCGFFPDLL